MTAEAVRTVKYSFTAEAMIPPLPRPWWQRLLRWLLRRPKDVDTNPVGTQPLIFDFQDGPNLCRMYIPAARLKRDDL